MAIGKSPVWELGLNPNDTLNLNQSWATPWPVVKIKWPITSDFPSFVVVRVKNLQTGVQTWWDIGQGGNPKPVRPLIMDQHPNRMSSQRGWGTLLYLTQAGCYAMQVSWPGGQWQLFFAAGRQRDEWALDGPCRVNDKCSSRLFLLVLAYIWSESRSSPCAAIA
jgi:hypothetical protein